MSDEKDEKTVVDTGHSNSEDLASLKNMATAVYALYAVSLLLGLTSIVGVIIAHIKREDAKGTWIDSHFKWQIRTFWWSLLWGIIGIVLLFAAGIGYLVLLGAAVWFIYRVVIGWANLAGGKEMYT